MKFKMFEDAELGGLHHGSGEDFDIFDPDKVGSGTGYLTYGWGFYLTTIAETAMEYAIEVAKNNNSTLKEEIVTLIREYCMDKNIPHDVGSDVISEIPFIKERNYSKPLKKVLEENSYQAIKRNIINSIDAVNIVGDMYLDQLVGILDALYPEIEKIIRNCKVRIFYYIKLVKDEGGFNFISYKESMPPKYFIKIINQLKKEGYNSKAEYMSRHYQTQRGESICDYLASEVFGGKKQKEVSMFLLRAGFDGIFVHTRKHYVIFDPNIIRIVEKTNV